jgi:hypothetical protein
MTAAAGHALSLRAVFREMFTVYRRHWAFLIPTAIVILLPQSILDATLDGLDVEGFESAKDIALFGAVLLTVAVNLMGQAIYAGLTAAADVDWRAGQPLPPISTLIRSLPLGGLIVLDILISIGAAVGLLLLVLPGLIFLAYVGISPAVMKLEHRGPLAALRRSVELVRGNLWRVFAIVAGVIVITELAVQAITFPFHGLALVTAVDLVAQGLLQPFEGLAIVIVAIRLLELRGQAAAPSAMARALVGEAETGPG